MILNRVSIAVSETLTQSNLEWGDEGFISVHSWNQTLREVREGTQVRNLEAGTELWRNTAYWLAPPGLFCALSFVYRTTYPAVAPPTVG